MKLISEITETGCYRSREGLLTFSVTKILEKARGDVRPQRPHAPQKVGTRLRGDARFRRFNVRPLLITVYRVLDNAVKWPYRVVNPVSETGYSP